MIRTWFWSAGAYMQVPFHQTGYSSQISVWRQLLLTLFAASTTFSSQLAPDTIMLPPAVIIAAALGFLIRIMSRRDSAFCSKHKAQCRTVGAG